MAISLVTLLAMCLCATTLVPSMAVAASGRITFSGAIVEPTCSVSTADSTAAAADATQTGVHMERLACNRSGNASRGGSPIYALTVMRLSGSVADQVLKYFDAYVKAGRSDVADPVLLTQIYE
ncbi:type 1 fimbrial protein [Rhodanobacter sp. C05]|uniref:type 1 fimbrial protein n=1 Tax=Rhodanobacter sp. C05 TaxID=1945855 RepID=UPI00117AF2D5|nr:type 1 fimbrial protein [Rhodanobacter sp. C05]